MRPGLIANRRGGQPPIIASLLGMVNASPAAADAPYTERTLAAGSRIGRAHVAREIPPSNTSKSLLERATQIATSNVDTVSARR